MKLKVFHEDQWRQYPAKVFTEHGWQEFVPRNVSGIKRIWPRSVTPPPSGTHYAWLGEPHASVSVRLDGDGNETARNLLAGGSLGPGVSQGGYWSRLPTVREDSDGIRYVTQGYGWTTQLHFPVTQGHYALAFYARQRERGTATGNGRVRLSRTFRDENDSHVGDNFSYYHPIPNDGQWHRIIVHAEAPLEAVMLTPYFLTQAESGDSFDFSRFMLTTGETEQEALAQVETYFDGSTESDRAHDLWYNTDGVPHEWVNGQGWTPLH